ncbi:fatty acyl-AMP ligase [Amycolatopsis tucumanensis]|uniref:Fatty acyl-AMP ligase n=1 Tax=Amycolatopsis tucumanensis TaxID=401106 RepID=A0ABP7HEB6_9PSEU|nr:fatty acyl-AMP ligase [Amycolatopsis tucumanensis]MCF6421403.1 fatty acyl-AMP ligase [Amycolatopsis tucumanensis]
MLLPDVLTSRAKHTPDATAYVFLDEDGVETAALTYRELHARALSVAHELSRHCAPGDRALLVFPQCLDFIVAFFACLYARVVAVPVNPPRRTHVPEATRAIVADCEPAVVLTLAGAPASLPGLPSITVDAVPGHGFTPPPAERDGLAFLQYTSGSTSAPKGVMVSHGNLEANQEMIRAAFGHDAESTVVGWAPFFHDQGLIGNVLQPLYVGARSILMSPAAFIRRPLLWLSAISRYRAHTSGGPNFAFDACVARARRGGAGDLDLSCWKVAFNGAEPIRPETLHEFARTFAPSGFDERALYPCYGLAEATLIVTGSRKGRGPRYAHRPDGALVAGSGTALPGEDVRIADPRDGVGEILVSGPHVTQGYWKRPAATAETFPVVHGRTYLRTGDLGMIDDGELYVLGRIKDVLIVRGRNHYPQDIEQTAQSAHPALRAGGSAAFGVPGADGERLVVVQEIQRDHRHDADPVEITRAVRAAVLAEHGLTIGDLVLTAHGQLAKTSSGKIMRSAARTRYLAGGFEGNGR